MIYNILIPYVPCIMFVSAFFNQRLCTTFDVLKNLQLDGAP
jgi:hypothetical protein